MRFAIHNIVAAYMRQGFICAACGKHLLWWDMHRKDKPGKWYPHRIDPYKGDGADNLVLLCTTPPENCHFNVGHGGVSLDHYEPFVPEKFPYFRGRQHEIKWDVTWKP